MLPAAICEDSPSGTTASASTGTTRSVVYAPPIPAMTDATRCSVYDSSTSSPTCVTTPTEQLPGVNGSGGFTW